MKNMQDFLASIAANNMHVIFEIIKYILILNNIQDRGISNYEDMKHYLFLL